MISFPLASCCRVQPSVCPAAVTLGPDAVWRPWRLSELQRYTWKKATFMPGVKKKKKNPFYLNNMHFMLKIKFLNRDLFFQRVQVHRLIVGGQRVLWKWNEVTASIICQIFYLDISLMLTGALMAICGVQLIMVHFSVPAYVRDVSHV